jgi:transcriptional regulator with XRE-family HTH domain
MITEDRRKRLVEKILGSKEYREAFVEEHIYTGIPFQVEALRNKKNWTQAQLGQEAHMPQARISRIENPKDGELNNLSTLIKIAHAFHIGLLVRFVPISEILEWELTKLSPDALKPLSIEDDPYFKRKTYPSPTTDLQTAAAGGSVAGGKVVDLTNIRAGNIPGNAIKAETEQSNTPGTFYPPLAKSA